MLCDVRHSLSVAYDIFQGDTFGLCLINETGQPIGEICYILDGGGSILPGIVGGIFASLGSLGGILSRFVLFSDLFPNISDRCPSIFCDVILNGIVVLIYEFHLPDNFGPFCLAKSYEYIL